MSEKSKLTSRKEALEAEIVKLTAEQSNLLHTMEIIKTNLKKLDERFFQIQGAMQELELMSEEPKEPSDTDDSKKK